MLQISLSDFAQKLSQQTGKNIHIYQSQAQQITASYIIDIKLNLIGHSHNSIQFAYELPWGASWLLKVFNGISSKKFTLNTSQKTLALHIDAFGEYRNALAQKQITAAHLHDNALILTLADAP